ncbi:MAG: hypothetical protein RI601_12265, partial [Desulfurivibrionaceae bacterium]|nr:hypothetical protein [Desulfurivibrionaceae bacterium]
MVKKETLYIVALIAFGLGFVGGVIFAAIKSTPLEEGPSQQAASQAPAQQDLSEAIAILEQQVA